jgi:hypothetical protein
MKPLVVCVTRQAELARQPVSASRSKGIIHSSVPACAAREKHPAANGDSLRRLRLTVDQV